MSTRLYCEMRHCEEIGQGISTARWASARRYVNTSLLQEMRDIEVNASLLREGSLRKDMAKHLYCEMGH